MPSLPTKPCPFCGSSSTLHPVDAQSCENFETNRPLRMYIALKILRAWNSGSAGFDSLVVLIIHDWIDAGMKGPVPYPTSPFFREWAESNGLSNIHGNVGYRFTAHIVGGHSNA